MAAFAILSAIIAFRPMEGRAQFARGETPARAPSSTADAGAEFSREAEQARQSQRGLTNYPSLHLPRKKPTHIIFVFVDHWEPGAGAAGAALSARWRDEYGAMARRHRDADGRPPQHTWFCSALEKAPLQTLAKAVFEGLGEMEIHIHHGTQNDKGRDNTAEMARSLDQYIEFLQSVGACRTAEAQPRTRFGFIHGMWALDNSRWVDGVQQWCGVNEELNLLLSKGCYADFTFPAWGTMEPRWRSRIYASLDSPAPKSYDDPALIRLLGRQGPLPSSQELVIFEGPNANTNVDRTETPTLARMRQWIDGNVRVRGREDWVFVKVYSHSAQNISVEKGYDAYFGPVADRFYSDIERVYNDGVNYRLHYATAREAYNMALAACDGRAGDPGDWRDYVIPPPANRRFFCDAFYRLLSYDPKRKEALVELLEWPSSVEIWAKDFTAAARVSEANSPRGRFLASDAALRRTANAPLTLLDRAPSRYYRFQRR